MMVWQTCNSQISQQRSKSLHVHPDLSYLKMFQWLYIIYSHDLSFQRASRDENLLLQNTWIDKPSEI